MGKTRYRRKSSDKDIDKVVTKYIKKKEKKRKKERKKKRDNLAHYILVDQSANGYGVQSVRISHEKASISVFRKWLHVPGNECCNSFNFCTADRKIDRKKTLCEDCIKHFQSEEVVSRFIEKQATWIEKNLIASESHYSEFGPATPHGLQGDEGHAPFKYTKKVMANGIVKNPLCREKGENRICLHTGNLMQHDGGRRRFLNLEACKMLVIELT